MTCENKIIKNITATCETQPVGGLKATIYLINRSEITSVTYDNAKKLLVTDLTLDTGKVAYKLVGTKKALKAGSERVVADDMPDAWKHKLSFHGYEFDSASVENMDSLGDLVAIVERNDASVADGQFVIYGMRTGLYPIADVVDSNDSYGIRKIDMETLDGQFEKESQLNLLSTDVATTRALLLGLLT